MTRYIKWSDHNTILSRAVTNSFVIGLASGVIFGAMGVGFYFVHKFPLS